MSDIAPTQPHTADQAKGEASVPEKHVLTGTETCAVDPGLERSLLRKCDIHVLPLLAAMYLCNSLDKSNLGNAKTDTLEKDLKLTGNQYNILLSVFYIPFVLCGPPMNLLTKRYGARLILPLAMLIFGGMALIGASCVNFGGITATRMILGAAESGFYPGVIFYLTTFYKRIELARRLSIYYAASQCAGAFTGLIAYGVFQVDGGLSGWQYLFLIEGGATVVVAVVSLALLPRSSATAYFLNQEERDVAYLRMAADSSVEVDAKFSFSKAIVAFKEDKFWPIWMLIGMGVGVPLYSVSNFLPQIVGSLGYNAVKTNLYTVAPNLVGTAFIVFVCFSSDHFRERCLHLTACMTTTFIGFLILCFIDPTKHIGPAYFCCFLISLGSFVSSPLLSTWYNNNMPDENQRAILTPVLVGTANAMGLVSSNVFRPQDAPRYVLACAISAGFAFFGAALTLCTGLWMRNDNRRRNREQNVRLGPQDVPTSELKGDKAKHPKWRWMGAVPGL